MSTLLRHLPRALPVPPILRAVPSTRLLRPWVGAARDAITTPTIPRSLFLSPAALQCRGFAASVGKSAAAGRGAAGGKGGGGAKNGGGGGGGGGKEKEGAAGGGGKKKRSSLLPLIIVFAIGSAAFLLVVRRDKEPIPALEDPSAKPRIAGPSKDKPTFTPDEVAVVFVLGGPGAGKGTQCEKLVRDFGFVHLSAGDLLRAEQKREGSEFGEVISTCIREGKIVPMEVTVALLENAMRDAITTQHKTMFLIDGFPRQMDQCLKFEREVCESRFTLFFDCPEDVMLQRLLKRGESSGRADDNPDSIRKRFRTYRETSYPVVEYYEKLGKVVRVDATGAPEEVYRLVKERMRERLRPVVAGKK